MVQWSASRETYEPYDVFAVAAATCAEMTVNVDSLKSGASDYGHKCSCSNGCDEDWAVFDLKMKP